MNERRHRWSRVERSRAGDRGRASLVRRGWAIAVGIALFGVGGAGILRADGPVVRDESRPTLDGRQDISDHVVADDFTVADRVRLDAVEVWLSDDACAPGDDNGVLDSFGGVLSWAVYSDDTGKPGSLIASGAAHALTLTDTGFNDISGCDVVRARFELDHPQLLTTGTYWLALHEGAWASAGDGSKVWWQSSAATEGAAAVAASDPTSPGGWASQASDQAFILWDSPLLWYEGELDTAKTLAISSLLSADDFTLSSPAEISGLDVWLQDATAGDNDQLDHFAGTLSWGIFADDAGQPGALLAHGAGDAVDVVDAGVQGSYGDLARARVRLSPPVALPAGAYWIGLHEGAWATPVSPATVLWAGATLTSGATARYSSSLDGSGGWGDHGYDAAFVLFQDLVFASGFEAGGTCAWSGSNASGCP